MSDTVSLELQTTKNHHLSFGLNGIYGLMHPLLSVCVYLHARVPKGGVDTQILPCMTFHPFYRVCTTCQTALRAAGSLPLCQLSLMKAFSSFCEKHNILFFLVNVIYCGSRGSNSRPRVSQAYIPPPNDTHNLPPP